MPDLKNLEALREQLQAETRRALSTVAEHAQQILGDADQALRAVREMPQGMSDLFAQARFVYTAEFETTAIPTWQPGDGPIVALCFGSQHRIGTLVNDVPAGRYRVICAIIPLPDEERWHDVTPKR